ncbi:MAG: sulfotransferase [Bacteroidota bacterium]
MREEQSNVETDLHTLLNYDEPINAHFKACIFHVSRCGSTLLTQMLAQSPRNIVLSEPTIINDILLSTLPEELKKHAIKKSMRLLGTRMNRYEEHLIVKLDSWHILFLNLIKACFPEVRIIFLFRDPLGVIQSHRIQRGYQMVSGHLNLNMVNETVPNWDLDGYTIKVLERFYETISEQSGEADLLMDYSELPDGLHVVLEKSGMSFSEEEKRNMLQRAAYHSKNRTKPIRGYTSEEYSGGPETERLQAIYQRLLKKIDDT